MMTIQEIYDICKAANIVLIPGTQNLRVINDIPSEMINTIKAHKNEIVEALSGYCFSRDVYTGSQLRKWKIIKCPNITDVSYPPVTVFSGSASEVDAWAKEHKDDPLFTDLYASKYEYGWCTDEKQEETV